MGTACLWPTHPLARPRRGPDVEGLLAGRPSGEGRESFGRWLEAKRAGWPLTLDALFAEDEE